MSTREAKSRSFYDSTNPQCPQSMLDSKAIDNYARELCMIDSISRIWRNRHFWRTRRWTIQFFASSSICIQTMLRAHWMNGRHLFCGMSFIVSMSFLFGHTESIRPHQWVYIEIESIGSPEVIDLCLESVFSCCSSVWGELMRTHVSPKW